MAYMGYGVWSLVWSSLVSAFLGTIQLWIYSKWSPSWVFNMEKFKDHFNYGYKLTLSGLLNTIFNNIYLIIIGRFFSPAQVGFYTRAETMKQLPVTNISAALNKVTFPLFASIQDDNVRLKRVYKQLMQMVVFIIAPVLIFLGVLAEPTFRFLFTEKWLPAVPYFQILCATGILYPIHAYNLNVLKVKGRADLVLKLQIIKKVQVVLVIMVSIQFGIYGLLYGQVFMSLSVFLINAFYTNKFINYSTWEQTKDITPIIFTAAIAGLLVYIENYYFNSDFDILRILIGGTLGVISYLILCNLFKIEGLNYLKNIINSRRKKTKKTKKNEKKN
jgi:teichuronic acid exporter